MSGKLPEVQEGRDGEKQLYKLVNQLRRQLPAPAFLRISAGPVSLLSTGQTEIVTPNVPGWVTVLADIVPDTITGGQVGAPIIRIGVSPFFAEVVALTNLGVGLVERRPVPLTVVTPNDAQTTSIAIDVQTAATGPSVLSVNVYLMGYYL